MKFKPRYFYMPTHPELYPTELIAFVDPDDWYAYDGIPLSNGQKRPYKSFDELYHHIEQRRKAEGHEKIDHLPEMVGHYLYQMDDCDKSLFSKVEATSKYPRTFMRDLQTGVGIAVSLSKAAVLGSAVTGSWGWVTKKVANKRASSCYNCPENRIINKNIRQRSADALANLFTGNRRTDYDKHLESCGVCGCPNRVKVHFSEEVILANHPEDIASSEFPARFTGEKDGRPHECWMKKILEKNGK